MSFYYLATPYSLFEGGLEEAFKIACKQTAFLTKNKIPVFSPIVYSHAISDNTDIDHMDVTLWMESQKPFLESAKGLIVLMCPGWSESLGVKLEIDFMIDQNKPVIYMFPDHLPEFIEEVENGK